MGKLKYALILGAGFSTYAGLPLQAKFTKELLSGRNFGAGPSRLLVSFISDFVRDAFDRGKKAPPNRWPELEDIFTSIDLSANTGHYLSRKWAPRKLRDVRRALISRTIRMLGQAYKRASKKKNSDRKAFDRFLRALDLQQVSFVSLNWDTALEHQLSSGTQKIIFDYGNQAHQALFPSKPKFSIRLVNNSTNSSAFKVRIVKIHGSINWLYCDNCRRTFWFPPQDYYAVADQILSRPQRKKFCQGSISPTLKCVLCRAEALATRIATFSYRKALDFSLFQKSWFTAERQLMEADAWIFIGYSLPAADFEFKYLLKRVQLCRRKKPKLFVITGGGRRAASETVKNYKRFFGRTIKDAAVSDKGLVDFRKLRRQHPGLFLVNGAHL